MKRRVVSVLLMVAVVFTVAVFGINSIVGSAQDLGEIDVYVIAGQGNAAGFGIGNIADAASDPRYTEGFNEVLYYGVADNNKVTTLTPVKIGQGQDQASGCVGPEVGIAREVSGAYDANAAAPAKAKAAVIKYAKSSTYLSYGSENKGGTWAPPSYISDKGITPNNTNKIGYIYNEFIATVADGVAALKAQGYTPVLKSVTWMHGESEATRAWLAVHYGEVLGYLVNDIRADLGEIFGSDATFAPFLISEIKNFKYAPGDQGYPNSLDKILSYQESVASKFPAVSVIDSTEFGNNSNSEWNYSANTQNAIGRTAVTESAEIDANHYVAVEVDGITVTVNDNAFFGAGSYEAGTTINLAFTTQGSYKLNSVSTVIAGKTTALTVSSNKASFNMPANDVKVVVVSTDSSPEVTPYGSIPSYYSASDYPFAFFKDGKLFGVYASINAFVGDNSHLLTTHASTNTIYLRRDYNTDNCPLNTQELNNAVGSFDLDLGGHSLISGKYQAFIAMSKLTAGETVVNIKNGKLLAEKQALFNVNTNGSATVAHTFTFNFSNVTVGLASPNVYNVILVNNGEHGTDGIVTTANFNFDRCVFDFKTVAPGKAMILFNLAEIASTNTDGSGNPITYQKKTNVTLDYCNILYSSECDEWLTFNNLGVGDTLTGNQSVTLELSSAEVAPTITVHTTNRGDKKFAKVAEEYDEGITLYALQNPQYAEVEDLKIGDAQHVETYPFFVTYRSGGSRVGTYLQCWSAYDWEAEQYANNYQGTSCKSVLPFVSGKEDVVVYLRRDYTITEAEGIANTPTQYGGRGGRYDNLCHYDSFVEFNLGGHTLASEAPYAIFAALTKSKERLPIIKMHSGTVCISEDYLVGATTGSVGGDGQNFFFVFEDLTIKAAPVQGSTSHSGAIVFSSQDNSAANAATRAHFKTWFINCNFDLTGLTSSKYTIADFTTNTPKAERQTSNTYFDNCEVITNGVTKVALNTCTDGADFACIKKNGDEFTLTFEFPAPELEMEEVIVDGVAEVIVNPKENIFYPRQLDNERYFTDENGNNYSLIEQSTATVNGVKIGTYVLALDDTSEYGRIPAEYKDAEDYPFILFVGGEFYSAEKYWINRIKSDGTLIYSNDGYADAFVQGALITARKIAGQGVTVLMRRDYQITERTANDKWMAHSNGTVDIDLGGNSIITGSEWLLNDHNSHVNTRKYVYTVYNGTVIITKSGLFRAYSPYATYSGRESTVNFRDLTVKFAEGATANKLLISLESATNVLNTVHVNFTDCVFDFATNKPDGLAFIDMSQNVTQNHIAHITTYGCTMYVDDYDSFTLYRINEGYDTFAIAKNEAGEMLKIVVKAGADAPKQSFGEANEQAPYLIGFNPDGSAVYEIATASKSNYIPKMNLTLQSDLIANVYVPYNATKSFKIDGTAYDISALTPVQVQGEWFYPISLPLAASESAKDIILLATVNMNGRDVLSEFTLSTVSYASKVIATFENTAAEKALARDMLAYIRSVYQYAGQGSSAEVAKINTVLGSYSSDVVKVEAAISANANIMQGVSLVLGATPRVRFFLPMGASAGDYAFKIGNETIAPKATGTESYVTGFVGYPYVDLEIPAYKMMSAITYSTASESGSYHINSYYDHVQTNGSAELKDLVAKFYNYCKSASAYRTEISVSSEELSTQPVFYGTIFTMNKTRARIGISFEMRAGSIVRFKGDPSVYSFAVLETSEATSQTYLYDSGWNTAHSEMGWSDDGMTYTLRSDSYPIITVMRIDEADLSLNELETLSSMFEVVGERVPRTVNTDGTLSEDEFNSQFAHYGNPYGELNQARGSISFAIKMKAGTTVEFVGDASKYVWAVFEKSKVDKTGSGNIIVDSQTLSGNTTFTVTNDSYLVLAIAHTDMNVALESQEIRDMHSMFRVVGLKAE